MLLTTPKVPWLALYPGARRHVSGISSGGGVAWSPGREEEEGGEWRAYVKRRINRKQVTQRMMSCADLLGRGA